MGIQSASQVYQWQMYQVFRGIKVMDNTVMYRSNQEKHDTRLRDVLEQA